MSNEITSNPSTLELCDLTNSTMPYQYPEVRRDESVVDVCHGVEVPDPYRWLEDPEAEEVQRFVELQNNITVPFLEGCRDREAIKTRLTELWDFPKYGCPSKRGQCYFHFKNSGLQNQSVLYMSNSFDEVGEVFLDPNTFSEDGTVAIHNYSYSKNGEVFAYGLSKSGSDWTTVHFKNILTGEEYPEVLERVKFSALAWTHDNKGLFYGRFDQEGKTDGSETTANENHKLYYHRLGTDQSEDVLVVEFPDNPKWTIGADVSDCGNYLIILPYEGCKENLVYFADLTSGINGRLELTPVVTKFEAVYKFITNEGPIMYFRTCKDAPNNRIASIDFSNPITDNSWTTVVAENKQNVLEWASCVNGNILVTCYIEDVKNTLQLRKLEDGSLIKDFTLDLGTIAGHSGRKEETEFFFKFASFLTPGTIFRVDLNSADLEPRIVREVAIKGFDSTNFTTQQVFYGSKDGTRIPMFINHRKDLAMNGNNPCLLYGYGGFNASMKPAYSVFRIVLMQHLGGVVALPNIRGGGEYGEKWHNGGRFDKKQNVFDDFQAAAQYLIENGYTSNEKITIQGGSNGGLLVGACVNQRPDLFRCAIAQVGVMDMLRFHKFTIGYAWCTDYGSPEEKGHFDNLIRYSPLHNVKLPEEVSVQYPALLLLTGDHDDRVVPLHSYKYISEVQAKIGRNQRQTNPLLLRVQTKTGHGAGKPTAKTIEELVDILCFMMQTVGLEFTP